MLIHPQFDPVAIAIGPVAVHWYGLMYLCAFVAFLLLGRRRIATGAAPGWTPEEVDDIEIEISVLTPMRKISSIDEIVMGKHGIYIKKGYASGTFLPQVATETGWTKEEFLGHCAKDKAHIGWDGWKDAEIYVYEAYVFGETDFE